MNSAQKLFAKVYEQAQQANQAGPGPDMGSQTGSNGGGSNDDVVDADFKEV